MFNVSIAVGTISPAPLADAVLASTIKKKKKKHYNYYIVHTPITIRM